MTTCTSSEAATLRRAHHLSGTPTPAGTHTTGSTAQACQDRKTRIWYTFRGLFFKAVSASELCTQTGKINLSQYLSTPPGHSVCASSKKKDAVECFSVKFHENEFACSWSPVSRAPVSPEALHKEEQLPARSEQDWSFQSSTQPSFSFPQDSPELLWCLLRSHLVQNLAQKAKRSVLSNISMVLILKAPTSRAWLVLRVAVCLKSLLFKSSDNFSVMLSFRTTVKGCQARQQSCKIPATAFSLSAISTCNLGAFPNRNGNSGERSYTSNYSEGWMLLRMGGSSGNYLQA